MDYPPNFINLIGQTFGELYVFEKAETDSKGLSRFLARCSCGNESRYKSLDLRKGNRTVCEKCAREAGKKATIEKREALARKILDEKREKFDISGLKVKEWTVLRPVKDGNFGCEYVCQCKCGRTVNYLKSLLKNELVPDFCKNCRKDSNKVIGQEIKKNREEKEELLFNTLDSAFCCKCNFELNISEFSRRRFKLESAVCKKCESEYNTLKRESWFEENNSKEFFNCPKCDCVFERRGVSDSFLKTRNPLCKECNKARNEKLADKYEKSNLKKKEIECSRCRANKPLSQYPPSFLRLSSPICSLCNMNYGRDYDKKKFELDPIYKEKKTIGEKIRKSLAKGGWQKDSTTASYLKISRDGFIKHIESLFREGMSWNNRSEWELDHVIPISTANSSEEIKELWYYKNLQPLWCWENGVKSNRLDWRNDDWAKDLCLLRIELGLDSPI